MIFGPGPRGLAGWEISVNDTFIVPPRVKKKGFRFTETLWELSTSEKLYDWGGTILAHLVGGTSKPTSRDEAMWTTGSDNDFGVILNISTNFYNNTYIQQLSQIL